MQSHATASLSTRRAALTLASLLIFSSCSSPHPDRLAADVDRYLGAMQSWAPVEVETSGTIERILKTQFVDEAEVRRQLADSRPRIQRHLHELHAYRPETPDVVAVHAEYTAAWIHLLKGYADLERGMERSDPAALSRGRKALLAWRRALGTVASDLRELVEVSHLEISKNKGPT